MPAARRDSHDDPLLVNIKPDIPDTIPQDPSPMHPEDGNVVVGAVARIA